MFTQPLAKLVTIQQRSQSTKVRHLLVIKLVIYDLELTCDASLVRHVGNIIKILIDYYNKYCIIYFSTNMAFY